MHHHARSQFCAPQLNQALRYTGVHLSLHPDCVAKSTQKQKASLFARFWNLKCFTDTEACCDMVVICHCLHRELQDNERELTTCSHATCPCQQATYMNRQATPDRSLLHLFHHQDWHGSRIKALKTWAVKSKTRCASFFISQKVEILRNTKAPFVSGKGWAGAQHAKLANGPCNYVVASEGSTKILSENGGRVTGEEQEINWGREHELVPFSSLEVSLPVLCVQGHVFSSTRVPPLNYFTQSSSLFVGKRSSSSQIDIEHKLAEQIQSPPHGLVEQQGLNPVFQFVLYRPPSSGIQFDGIHESLATIQCKFFNGFIVCCIYHNLGKHRRKKQFLFNYQGKGSQLNCDRYCFYYLLGAANVFCRHAAFSRSRIQQFLFWHDWMQNAKLHILLTRHFSTCFKHTNRAGRFRRAAPDVQVVIGDQLFVLKDAFCCWWHKRD